MTQNYLDVFARSTQKANWRPKTIFEKTGVLGAPISLYQSDELLSLGNGQIILS